MKLLKESVSINFYDFEVDKHFLDMTKKHKQQKIK